MLEIISEAQIHYYDLFEDRPLNTLVVGLAPISVSPEMQHARDLIRALYCLDCVGGALHIVLDDGNIEDSSVTVCAEMIDSSAHLDDASPSQVAIERELLGILQGMSVAERGILLGVDPDEDDAEDVG